MIEIPVGKAIAAVESGKTCRGCCFNRNCKAADFLACSEATRKDRKDVVFKMIEIGKK